MKRKLKILLLAGNTSRAKSYAQILAKNTSQNEVQGLFFGHAEKEYAVPTLDEHTLDFLEKNGLFVPDLSESLDHTFQKREWSFTHIHTADANGEEVLSMIASTQCDIVVFAGYGGQILKEPHFYLGKKYLHMHPGELPIERGSTTIYYSILNKRQCSVTAFYMTEKIDAGEDVLCQTYPLPKRGVNIDAWFDNIIRADCLERTIEIIGNQNDVLQKTNARSEEYYVIHPVLKHVALLSLK